MTTSMQHAKEKGNNLQANVAPFSLHAAQAPVSQSSLKSTQATLLKLAANARIQSSDRSQMVV